MASIDTTPAVCPWKVYAGDRNLQLFTFYASEGVPWDLTGAVLSAQARASATDATVAVDAVCTITDPAAGLATVEWDGEAVRTLLGAAATWAGVWDLQVLESGATLPLTLVKGPWTADMDVTRAVSP